MTSFEKHASLSIEVDTKKRIMSICNQVLETSLAQGWLKRPKSMRNLRRWLRRELVKHEGMPSAGNHRKLIDTALKLLMVSGLLLSGIPAAQAAVAFEQILGVTTEAFIDATPTAIDIDGDEDLDVFSGDYHGQIFFSENTGTKESVIWTVRTGAENPFNGIDVGDDSAPTFADIDNDGDYDAFVGELTGAVKFFENTGAYDNPVFTERTGAANPLNGVVAEVNGNKYSKPVFVDLDNDKDLDAVVGMLSGGLRYFENEGTVDSPTFTERTGVLNPLDGVSVSNNSAPSFVDLDKDGDFDVILGSNEPISYFENTGSTTTPAFTKHSGHLNPLEGINHTESAPTFADMDFDGDKDLILGWSGGRYMEYYKNIPKIVNNGTFTEVYGADNPLDGFNTGNNPQPAFVDIDNDGDMDLFVGNYDGHVKYFKNTNTATNPVFDEQVGVANPLDAVAVSTSCCGGAYVSPTFADIDDDGDMDFFAGGYYGNVQYFENTDPSGDRSNPTFVERTGAENPLDAVSVAGYSNPVFADIDNDGDLDFFVGEAVKYFENTNTAANPVFVERTGVDNPLDGFRMDYNPAFVDVDGDGDLDVFSGDWWGKVNYVKNIGRNNSPVFEAQTGTANLFYGFDVGYSRAVAAPAFVDIDNDGDLDAFVGEWDGPLHFFRNNPHTGGNSAPTFSSTPTISGTPKVGGVLDLINIATTDADTDHVTLSYQWKADNVDIAGATSGAYLFSANDLSRSITCYITANDVYGGSTPFLTAGVSNSAPTFDSTPAISGTATVGEPVSLTNTKTTDVDGDSVTLRYQWKANGTNIVGANSATYTLTANESGKSITAAVTADDSKGGITSVTTTAVSVSSGTNSGDSGGGGGSTGYFMLLLLLLRGLFSSRRKMV